MISEETYHRIAQCVQAQVAGEMTEQDIADLEAMVMNDEESRRVYMLYILETAELHRWSEYAPRDIELNTQPPDVDIDFVMDIVRADAEAHKRREAEQSIIHDDVPHPIWSYRATESEAPRRTLVIPRWLVWAGVAAAAVITLAFIFKPASPGPVGPPSFVEEPDESSSTSAVVATLIGQFDAVWDVTGPTIGTDGAIHRGSVLRLDRGLAKIRFANGAEVILQAPASVEPIDDQHIKLSRGKIVAYCPVSAHGFTVQANNLNIIDLGTEFGVQVDASGTVDAQVFTGEVEVNSPQADISIEKKRVLSAGEAVLHDPARGTISLLQATPHRFVREQEFQANLLAAEGSAYDRWLAASHRIRRDPDLVAYYTFERDADKPRRLTNLSAAGEELDGWLGLSGELPEWVEGRFKEKQGLRFNNQEPLDPKALQGARVPHSVRLNLQDQFTLAAWICTPKYNVYGGGPILSYRDAPQGNMGFQLGVYYARQDRRRPSIQFGSGNEIETVPHGRVFQSFSTTRMGESTWHHLVAVYANEKVSFYIDGELAHEAENTLPPRLTDDNTPLTIGAAPWPMAPGGETGEKAAGFVGIMDEIAIFRRSLSGKEVAEMYRDGKPETPNQPEDSSTP